LIDGNLIRLQTYEYNGDTFHHRAFMKTGDVADLPQLTFRNNVIAITDVNHGSYSSLQETWAVTVHSSNNYYLNLSDTPLPSNYPMPPAGWTVLQGQAARDYWAFSRDTWIANHVGSEPLLPSPPPHDEEPPPPPTGSLTFEKRIVLGTDDAEQRGTSVDLSSSDIELIKDGLTPQVVGLRFQGIQIPTGATVTNAHITFTSDETDRVATNLIIYGHDIGDTFTFANTSNNITGRAKTDASATWAPEAWSIVGQVHNTTDLSAIVNEIVDRPDWATGNGMAFIFTGTGERTAEAFESGASTAPQLHVEYFI
jgi:hypothetical protein